MPVGSLALPAALPPPAASSLDEMLTPELATAQPNVVEPVEYEILRQDATGGNVLPENPYLVPAAERQQAARPVDLTALLTNQQENAAAGSVSAPAPGSQQRAVRMRNSGLTSTQPSRPAPQPFSHSLSLGTDVDGIDLISFEESDLVGSTASAAGSMTAASTSDVLFDPLLPTSLSPVTTAGPSPPTTQSFPLRLPSYEESMLSDTARLSLSPAGSLLSSTGEMTAEPSSSASVLPSYESPPAYASDKLLQLNANTPLKSRQVQQLQDEIASAAGIRVQLDKTQCAQALALVDCFDRVWYVVVLLYTIQLAIDLLV